MYKIILSSILLFALTILSGTTIYQIQYTDIPGPDGTYPSPMVDDVVTVTGIVTGANFNHDSMFFMSDPFGGAWHGIYVYDYEVGPALGDEVEVTGTVTEYYGFTELGYCTITVLSSGNPVPVPIPVTTEHLTVLSQAEMFEGCLVEVNDVIVTEPQDEYGQWYINDGSGECQVDDSFFYLDEVAPPIVITEGMEWAIIRGCLDFSYDVYGLNPRTPDDLIEEILFLEADFTANHVSGIVPLEVQFSDLSTGNIVSWMWDFNNDGFIDSNQQNPSYSYFESGFFSVSLTISDGDNEDTEIKEDYILVMDPLIADFSADLTSGNAPLEVHFTDLSTGDVVNWLWDFNNDGIIDSYQQNPSYIYSEAGLYTVSLSASDGVNEEIEIKEDYITVIELLNANFIAEVTSGDAPLEVHFTDLSTGDVVNWLWDFNSDGFIDSNEQNPTNIYYDVGIYTISLLVTDDTSEDIEIKEDYIEITGTGTQFQIIPRETELSDNHPNPFNPTTKIQFDIKDYETGVLTIFNIKGQKMVSQSFYSGRHDFMWNDDNYSSGIYFYKLQTENFSETKKMLLLK